MHRPRLTTATAAAAVVVLVGSAVAVAAGDPTPTPPPRIAVVARGDGSNFADALAVGSVAGQLGAPVFTTPATSLSTATAAALTDYAPELVIITGGTAAISADVETDIEQATGLPADQVVRAAGTNRYETAAEIAAIFDELSIDAAFLPVGATATDADLLDGKDASAFQPAGNYLTPAAVQGLLPIATFYVDADGSVMNWSHRAPVTGKPIVSPNAAGEYLVALPGVDVGPQTTAVCTARDRREGSNTFSSDATVRASSVFEGTELIIHTNNGDGIHTDIAFQCAIYEAANVG